MLRSLEFACLLATVGAFSPGAAPGAIPSAQSLRAASPVAQFGTGNFDSKPWRELQTQRKKEAQEYSIVTEAEGRNAFTFVVGSFGGFTLFIILFAILGPGDKAPFSFLDNLF